MKLLIFYLFKVKLWQTWTDLFMNTISKFFLIHSVNRCETFFRRSTMPSVNWNSKGQPVKRCQMMFAQITDKRNCRRVDLKSRFTALQFITCRNYEHASEALIYLSRLIFAWLYDITDWRIMLYAKKSSLRKPKSVIRKELDKQQHWAETMKPRPTFSRFRWYMQRFLL